VRDAQESKPASLAKYLKQQRYSHQRADDSDETAHYAAQCQEKDLPPRKSFPSRRFVIEFLRLIAQKLQL